MVTSVLILVGVVVGLDLLARFGDSYRDLDARWPAGWRAVPLPPAAGEGPYRAGERVRWERVVPKGIPRAVSLASVAAMGFALLWSFAVVLAIGDGLQALNGVRPAGKTLASLLLCVARAGVQWYLADAALARRPTSFAARLTAALALDLALATLPIPCSDKRSDDVVVAHVGLGVDLALALAFALSAWRRRGLVARDPDAMSRMN